VRPGPWGPGRPSAQGCVGRLADAPCDRLAPIDQGRVLAEGPPRRSKREFDGASELRTGVDGDRRERAGRLSRVVGEDLGGDPVVTAREVRIALRRAGRVLDAPPRCPYGRAAAD
jgi:hypothetical protein